MTKLKNSNCDNSKTEIVTKLRTQFVTNLKNYNSNKTQNLKFKKKTQNQNCDKIQIQTKLKKTQIVIKKKP